MVSDASKSSLDPIVPKLEPLFEPSHGSPKPESEEIQSLIDYLKLQPHVEGGYFVETDRDRLRVPNPFKSTVASDSRETTYVDDDMHTRSASTSIHYLLTPHSPLGAFHRNKGRTVHTVHRGRGRYVIIHADEVATPDCPGGYGPEDRPEHQIWTAKARVETFIVGTDVLKGERLQWVVEGGKYKSSFLLPDHPEGSHSNGLLISETVVPGFEYEDHDFMRPERMIALVSKMQADEMSWMLREISLGEKSH